MNFIEIVLCRFEPCFSRKAVFRWFVTITVGLMLRSDKLGLTFVIRDLALSPGSYDSMLHFFRASSWSLEDIRRRWFSAAMDYALLYREGCFHVLVCDGDTAERFHPFCQRVPPWADTLPEDAFQAADVRSRCHALSAETFFGLLGKRPELRITQIIQEQQNESGTYWGSWAWSLTCTILGSTKLSIPNIREVNAGFHGMSPVV